MSTEGGALYSRKLFLLALKGQITVQFTDGHILEGEFITQDEFNIFLILDDKPMMIPRSQIRYILGRAGQQIEEDTSQETLLEAEPAQAETPDLSFPETAQAAEISKDDTFVIEPDEVGLPAGVRDTDITDVDMQDTEDDGMTFVLEQESPEAEGDLDELTVVLDQEKEFTVSAQLVCTAGPHAGQIFDLRSGVITLGRASDNEVSLSGDKEISRRHAIIVQEAGKFIIQDQNSLNGTLVNDEPIEGPRQLENGDIVVIGISILEYREQ
jgi:hypothetical protein